MNTNTYILFKICLQSLLIISLPFLVSCSDVKNRIKNIGKVPALTAVKTYEKALLPMQYSNASVALQSPQASNQRDGNSNSIWQSQFQGFMTSYRIGDIISVQISIKDKAQLNNKTEKNRNSSTKFGLPNLFGIESVTPNGKNSSTNPYQLNLGNLLGQYGQSNSIGNGNINRSEIIETEISAVVVGMLPSGNLLIKGSQELRVNYELREITIEGIVRQQDITANNSVKLSQIAEARLSYGGRGQIFEFQQDPYGKQFLDVVLPF